MKYNTNVFVYKWEHLVEWEFGRIYKFTYCVTSFMLRKQVFKQIFNVHVKLNQKQMTTIDSKI